MIKIKEISSGVRLLLEPMETVRSVSIGIWCNNGSVNESAKEQGISHYIEHMLFKGTTSRSTFDIVNEIDRLGGQMNAFTGKESTCFYVKCLDRHFREAADVLTDMICNPRFEEAEMEKEKLVVIEEINMNKDDPDDVALDHLEQIICRGTGMAHPVLGSKETVSSFTREGLQRYYFDHYTRDEIVVSVAGSFREEEVVAYFEGKFGNLKAKREREIVKTAPSAENRAQHTIEKEIEQSHLAMGISTVSASDARRYPLALLSNILGGGMSSRLFQNVREKKGLAYSVYSMTGFYSHTGLFVIAAGVAKERTDEALAAIAEEIGRLEKDDISEEEFLSAKEQMKSSFIFGQESVQNRMITNGRNMLAFGRCRTQNEMLSTLDAISREDVLEAKALISEFARYSMVNVTGRKNS